MKSIARQSRKRAAFTIVELLVVMSIIMILMGILLPAFNKAKQYARKVEQTAQFKSIDVGLELYRNEFEGYPDSDGEDASGYNQYPGAMKLAEAMMGQDLLGFHPSSRFDKDGQNPALPPPYDDLYPRPAPNPPYPPWYLDNLRARKGPYLNLENANPYSLLDLYGAGNVGQLGDTADPNGGIVLCDEYKRIRNTTTGKRVGSPILYYKADVSSTTHDDTSVPTARLSIYNCQDNQELIDLGIAWDLAFAHPMASGGTDPDGNPAEWEIFYRMTRDEKVGVIPRPKMVDSYILISAGYDGLYGTRDDIFNFGEGQKPR